MRDILLVVFFLGLVPKMLFNPFIGILVWTWLAYMMPHTLAYGFAQSVPFSMITGTLIVLSAVLTREPKRLPLSPLIVWLIIFNFWMLLTTTLSLYPTDAWAYESKTFKSQLINFITIIFINSYERVKTLLWVVVLSIGFYMVKGGIFTLITAGNYMVQGPEGSYLGNNTIGLTAAMLVPLIRFLQINESRLWMKRCFTFMIICCVLVCAGSYSRGAILAVGGMGGFLWLKSSNKLPVLLLVIILGAVTYSFMPEKWTSRMDTVQTYEEDASAMGRINAWEMSWNFSKDHPIFGGGFEMGGRPELFAIYAPFPNDIHDFHSNYFSLLAHQGYVGLFMYLLIMRLAWRTGSSIIKKCKTLPEMAWAGNLAAMIQVSLIGYWIGGAFLNLAYWDLPYLLIALLVILDQLVKKYRLNIKGADGYSPNASSSISQRKYEPKRPPKDQIA